MPRSVDVNLGSLSHMAKKLSPNGEEPPPPVHPSRPQRDGARWGERLQAQIEAQVALPKRLELTIQQVYEEEFIRQHRSNIAADSISDEAHCEIDRRIGEEYLHPDGLIFAQVCAAFNGDSENDS